MCTCDSSLGSSADPATLTLSRNPLSILIQQSGSVYQSSAFEELVQSIFFAYDPTRPSELVGYQAEVAVTVNDGMFSSEPASTMVQVNVMNEAPRVLLDGQVRRTNIERTVTCNQCNNVIEFECVF